MKGEVRSDTEGKGDREIRRRRSQESRKRRRNGREELGRMREREKE